MGFSPNVSQDWKMSTLSPGPEDSGRLRIENNQLKLQVKQLTVDLQSEQGKLTLSPGPEDSGRLRIENNQLKLQVKQLTVDLQSEQGALRPYRDVI